MKFKLCTTLVVCSLLAACAGGPSNADISAAVTAYTKDRINKSLGTASALGGAKGREIALKISGQPDPDTLPAFACEKDNISKGENGDYTGKIHCKNPEIRNGEVFYSDIVITQTGDHWTLKDMSDIN